MGEETNSGSWARHELHVMETLHTHTQKLDQVASDVAEIKTMIAVGQSDIRLKTGFLSGAVSCVVALVTALVSAWFAHTK